MVAVITAVLAGSTAALVAILASDHSLVAALISGGLVALSALVALIRFEQSTWNRADAAAVSADEEAGLE